VPQVEPPPTGWSFPPSTARTGEVVGVGGDLEPGTLLAAYRSGIFPMPVEDSVLAWWSPDPRAILPLDQLAVSTSLRRARHRYEVRVDTAFAAVVDRCAATDRPGAWITPAIRDAYLRLHRLGWAHSVESWSPEGELAGGLYGVAVGGLFAGESMFHARRDASKVALVALVELLGAGDGGVPAAARAGRLLDVQWLTPHLASLGAVEVSRRAYLGLLRRALRLPPPPAFAT
jgi:leucyl/phenylalanyl-tRNA--protein transferase